MTVVGGLLVAGFADRHTARRSTSRTGAALAAAGGAWFIVGPTISRLWNDGVSQTGAALGGTTQQVLELLTYYSALGVVIVMIAAHLTSSAARPVTDEPPSGPPSTRDEPVADQEPTAVADAEHPTTADDAERGTFVRRRRHWGPRRGTRVD